MRLLRKPARAPVQHGARAAEDDVGQRVIRVLADLLMQRGGAIDIEGQTHVVSDLGLDSLQVLELVFALEREFGIVVSDQDLLNQGEWLTSVDSMAAYVCARRQGPIDRDLLLRSLP